MTLAERPIYTVASLNRALRSNLEREFLTLRVSGEISGLSRASSGHLYFTLKDEFAQIRCAMFRMRHQLLTFEPRNGMEVIARARATLYEPRGECQLVVEGLQLAGDGALRQRFEALKQRLDSEGLFAEGRKRPLPPRPHCIGIVTSANGAALHDILTVIARRAPLIPVIIYPTRVQGEGAAEEIARQIAVAGQRRECDLLIVGRGGGSLEDLWAFNEEVVARAIVASPIPIVSAVGHEIDITIADGVADLRAATPSAAAELVTADQHQQLRQIIALNDRLQQAMRQRLCLLRQQIERCQQRLIHPARQIQQRSQRLDELLQRLIRSHTALHRQRQAQLATLHAQLQRHAPHHLLQHHRNQLAALKQRLEHAIQRQIQQRQQRLQLIAQALHLVSPLAVLERGYAIATTLEGQVIRHSESQRSGDQLHLRLQHGALLCRIESNLHDDTPHSGS
jgi:exodeoxyribonuclease VII large subunit